MKIHVTADALCCGKKERAGRHSG